MPRSKNKKIPSFLRATLWSYDIRKLDIENDKRVIIESVLNHGGDKEVKWLLRTYTQEEIVSVLQNSSRGFWDKRSLMFWCEIFDVQLEEEKHEKAIKQLYFDSPRFLDFVL